MNTVAISRVIENTLYLEGRYFGQKLTWTEDASLAPFLWMENRMGLRRHQSTSPGLYRETGRIINAVTGEVIESYDAEFRIHAEPPVPYSEAESPDLSRWQVAILILTMTPGALAMIACLPLLAIAYGSFKVLYKLQSAFEFLQTLNAPEPHDQNPCA